MRVAAIDCGTNSIRLLIADVEGTNFREVFRDMEIVRLGQGVDKTGQFHPDAIVRTLAAVDKYALEIAKRGVEKIRFCATSATRDATNRDLFIDGVKERLGIAPEVIPGEVEAALSFQGATKDFNKAVTRSQRENGIVHGRSADYHITKEFWNIYPCLALSIPFIIC